MQTTQKDALIDIIGVLLRANTEGGLWRALDNEGITDAYMLSMTGALMALGPDGIATLENRYEVKVPEDMLAELAENVGAQHHVTVKHAGPAPATRFMQELLESVETLAGIADEHGPRTLADLMYLQQAILNGGFIDYYPGESKVLEIAESLPSSEQWTKFIKVECAGEADDKSHAEGLAIAAATCRWRQIDSKPPETLRYWAVTNGKKYSPAYSTSAYMTTRVLTCNGGIRKETGSPGLLMTDYREGQMTKEIPPKCGSRCFFDLVSYSVVDGAWRPRSEGDGSVAFETPLETWLKKHPDIAALLKS